MKRVDIYLNELPLRKYVFLLVIFLVLILFGKNLQGIKKITQIQHDQELDVLNYENQSYDSIRVIDREVPNYLFQSATDLGEKGYYRLTFELKGEYDTQETGKNITLDEEEEPRENSLVISLKPKSGPIKTVKKIPLSPNNSYLTFEEIVQVDDLYQGVLFEREHTRGPVRFFIKNPRIKRIEIDQATQISQLKPVLVGNTNFDTVAVASTNTRVHPAYGFRRQAEVMGQVFKATNPYLSAVDLKIKIQGNGGVGKYRLEVRKAEKQGKEYLVSSQVMAGLEFGADEIWKYKDTSNTTTENKDLLHLPLATFLEPDSYYFIGLNNQGVDFNLLNRFELYESGSKSAEGAAVTLVNGRAKRMGNDLYYKIYGAEFKEASGSKLLTNSITEDVGNGKGLYSYELKQWFPDVLDLDRAASLQAMKQGSIFFDTLRRAVVASATPGMELSYQVNTVYPFTQIFIEADEIEDGYTGRLHYSLDKVNWQEVTKDEEEKKGIGFEELIAGNGKANQLYLRFTYDPEADHYRKNPIFGLGKMKITADLAVD